MPVGRVAPAPVVVSANDSPTLVNPGFETYGLYYTNSAQQWLQIGTGDQAEFIPPSSRGTIALSGEPSVYVAWGAPGGVSQPSAVAGQQCKLRFTERPLDTTGGSLLGTQISATAQLERFAKSNIPAANIANAGRLIELTDYDQSLWVQDALGVQFFSPTSEVFNPKAFGVVANGIVDDTVNIQKALTAVGANGGAIHFPPGTYKCTASLVVSSNCLVTGSWAALFQMSGAWTGSKGLFTFAAGGVNMIIENLRIDGLRTGKSITSTARGIYIQSASNVRVRRMHISDCSHAGILVDGGADIAISDNYVFRGGNNVDGAYANGISVDIGGAALARVAIYGNVIDGATDSGIGLHDNVTGISCTGNVINHVGIGHGIDVAGIQSSSVTGNTVIASAGVTGIYIHQNLATYNALDVTIAGNTLVGPGAAGANGISIGGTVANPADRLTIVGNTIRGWSAGGIYIGTECQFSTISANTITGCTTHGINLDQAAGTIQYLTITGNTVIGNSGWGINSGAAVVNCKIMGNLLFNNTSGGINLTGAQKANNFVAFNGPQDDTVRYVADLQRSRQTPAFAATITPDPTLGEIVTINYTSSFTIANPTNAVSGQTLTFKLQHDNTGGVYVITWAAQFKRAGGAFANTNAVNAVDQITFQYDGSAGSWNETGRALNLS